MVIKVKNPLRWFELPMGEVIALEGDGTRPVRLEVNTVTHASFKVVYPNDKVAFLATVNGMETIEFIAHGPCEVWVDSEAEVYFYTDDGRNIAFVNDGKVSFAIPHQRRTESEQIIYMQSLMIKNMERRNARLEVAVQAMEAVRENGSGPDTGTVPESAGEPPVVPAADAPAAPVAEAGAT